MRGRPFYGARAFIYAAVYRVFDVPCAEKTPSQGKRTPAVPPHTAAACLGEVCLRAERTNLFLCLARNCSIRAKAARQAYKAKRRLKAAFLLTALCRAAGGTFGFKHEPDFNYKRKMCVGRIHYKIAVKNTENINANNGIRLQIAITKNLCFCLQIFALMLI